MPPKGEGEDIPADPNGVVVVEELPNGDAEVIPRDSAAPNGDGEGVGAVDGAELIPPDFEAPN